MELGKTWEQGGKKKRERGKMRSKGEQGGHQGTPRDTKGNQWGQVDRKSRRTEFGGTRAKFAWDIPYLNIGKFSYLIIRFY